MNDLPISSMSTDINPDLVIFVKVLFENMLLNFGKKFTDQWGAIDPEKMEMHWCKSLKGFTPRECKRGLAALQNLTWPPSLPEFKRLCRPAPDPVNAYYEALEGIRARFNGEVGVWSHPAIFWAAMPLSYDLQHKTFSEMKTRWENALSEQFNKNEWEKIPEPQLAIEQQKDKISVEKASQFLRSVGMKNYTRNQECLDWAEKILSDQSNYPAISVAFAKEAKKNKDKYAHLPG